MAGYPVVIEQQVTLPVVFGTDNISFVPYARYRTTRPVTDATGSIKVTLRPSELQGLPGIWYTQYRVILTDPDDPSQYLYVNDDLHVLPSGKWLRYIRGEDDEGNPTLSLQPVEGEAPPVDSSDPNATPPPAPAVPLELSIVNPVTLFSDGTAGPDIRPSIVRREIVRRSEAAVPDRVDLPPGEVRLEVYSADGQMRESEYVYHLVLLGYVKGDQELEVSGGLTSVPEGSGGRLGMFVNVATSADANLQYTNASSCLSSSCFSTETVDSSGQSCATVGGERLCIPVSCSGQSCSITITTEAKRRFLPCAPLDVGEPQREPLRQKSHTELRACACTRCV